MISLRSITFSLLVAWIASLAGPVRADAWNSQARLAKLHAEIASARGPFAYVALRHLWSEWDRSDPNEIEEVLSEVASDASESAPIRSYAGLLEAYARRRRGDLNGARTRVARLGYVGRWMSLGPFDNDGKAGFDAAYEPDAETTKPLNVAHDYDGKDHRPARWRLLPAVSPYGWVDFGTFVRPVESVCVYATTFVRDDRAATRATRPISIWAGGAGAMRLSWNGAVIITDDKYRDLDSDRFAATVSLEPGWNRLSAKVCGDDRRPMLSVRIATPGGDPDAHVQVDADPSHSTPEGGAAKPTAKPIAGSVEGAVQAFERLVRGEDAAALEAYAQYLEATGADDPTEHRARELARKAAEKAPTISRLLLASTAAENRNQQATWIEKAERLAANPNTSRADAIRVLLARADYARAGVNPRDSVPYYERVLALDPDDVSATLAKVDLYEATGLRDTGLALLHRALLRRPQSVGLLRAAVAALREAGREAEGDEMAERYASLRFDDPSFIRGRIDLAVARRDTTGAAHWIERLMSANPDSAAALQTAAQSWMRLGDRTRALAIYRTALEIAPEDTDMMRQLASAYGVGGERDEQLGLLRRILTLMPHAKDVRDELSHLGPAAVREDEAYARPAPEFLANRGAAAQGQSRRSLVDLQVTTVFPNGLASRFHQVVYQPLTDSPAAQSREYELAYEMDSEAVQLRAARVYRKDGRIEEAVENGAGAMADDPALAIYTSSRSYYVRFPRLEPGDVVEIQYRVEDIAPRNAFADYFGEVIYMQSGEPIARSEYVLLTPKSRTFYFNDPHVPGLEKTTEERPDLRVFHFLAKNVPALEQENVQPPWAEVLGHVSVSTYRSWDDMGRWYWGLVKDQFVPDDEVRRRAEALTKGLTSDEARARAIYDYVVQKTRYVALEFGIHGFKPYRCAQIFARGFGDCKDKATLIVTMLESLGIKATPVIVRTGNKGDIETSPASLAPFDHMIAYVPSLDLYLDGTAEYTGAHELPAMDRNALALQVNEGAPRLVHLPDPPATASVSANTIDATITADGAARLDWRADVSGVEAAEWRVRFHAEATRKQRVQQMVAANLPGSEVTTIDAGNLEDVEQPVSMRMRGTVPQFAREEGDALSIPLGRREHMVRDYATETTRTQDVRMQAQWTEKDDWTVHLPPGAKVKSAPVAAAGSSPFGAYALEVDESGNALHVKTTISLTKTRIAAADYASFRLWCTKVDSVLGQRATVSVK